MRRRLPAVLLALLLGCGPAADHSPAPVEAAPADPAPRFVLPDLSGAKVDLQQLRGRPVVIDFWATWCAPCLHQIPVLNAFQEHHPEDVVVLGVAVDVGGRDVVAPFAREHDIRYRVLLGDESLAQRYGAFGFPSLYVVGPDGGIAMRHVGLASQEELEEAVAGWVPQARRN